MINIIQDGESINISLTRGNSLYAEVGMNRDGEPYVPEEGDAIRFAAMGKNGAIVIRKEIPAATRILHIQPEDTSNLPYGEYDYNIKLTTAGGDADTFIVGTLKLTKEVQ